jgi:hypothetical protein
MPRLYYNRYSTEMALAFTDQTLAAKIDVVDQYLAPLHGRTKWNKVCLKMKPRYFRQPHVNVKFVCIHFWCKQQICSLACFTTFK